MRGARPKGAGRMRQGGDTAESDIIPRCTAQRVNDESRIGGLAHAREGRQSAERNCLRRRAQQRRGSNDEGHARSKPGHVQGKGAPRSPQSGSRRTRRLGAATRASGGGASGESDSSHYHPKRYLSPMVIRDVPGRGAGKVAAVGSDFQERNSRARSRLSSLRARSMDAAKRNRGHQQPTARVLTMRPDPYRLRQSRPPRRPPRLSRRRSILSAQGASACSQEQGDRRPDHGGL